MEWNAGFRVLVNAPARTFLPAAPRYLFHSSETLVFQTKQKENGAIRLDTALQNSATIGSRSSEPGARTWSGDRRMPIQTMV
jgi:hypothetical protein